jgi:spore coat polysaccharide biosynthesis protein SpsF (cytidylyltransferase family)
VKTIVIVQARLGSTRLPRKVLADICGKPMIQHVIERAREINNVDRVVLAVHGSDVDELYPSAKASSIFAHSGDQSDVLGRFYYAALPYKPDVILRVTGDCPLIDPVLCNDVRCLVPTTHPYGTLDTRRSGFPDGLDCEAFTMEMLEMAHERATDPYDREHVTTWMQRACSVPGTSPYPVLCREQDEFGKVKLSVDTETDLSFVRRIMARIPAGDYSWKATQEAIRAELPEKS